jgi:hypothetical protein
MSKNQFSSLGELSSNFILEEQNSELIYQPYNTTKDVYFHKTAGLWIASIDLKHGGRRKYLGMHLSKQDAEKEVKRASRMYNLPYKL